MILIKLDKKSKYPLFEQIVEQVKKMIIAGDLQPGENLPSTRKLAETLGVHRTTVYRAYEELWAAGYLESTSGGYSRVRQRPRLADKPAEEGGETFDWQDRFSEAFRSIAKLHPLIPACDTEVIDFRPLGPDPDLLPVDDFRKCMNQALQTEGAKILQYGDPMGYRPLREYLASQMRQHGVVVGADEIVLSNGMQNGIEMVLRLLTNPGDLVFTESPTYVSTLSLLKYLGVKVACIPMLSDGMDLDELENQLKNRKPKLIYTIPTFHNPTGVSSSQAHREKLLELCERYHVPLVEDAFEEEMKYFGKAVLPIKSMDKKQMVIYLGTFSKVLFPGVRIGWIAAPRELSRRFGQMKQVTDLSGSPLTQAAVYQFCKQGLYELHKKRVHRAYRKRMQVALAACREFLPAELIRFTKPEGGYLIWLTLDRPAVDESRINELLIQQGVALSPGSRYFPATPEHVHFRLSIAHRKESEIRDGIRRIGTLIQKLNNDDIN